MLRASIPFEVEVQDLAFRCVEGQTIGLALLSYGPGARLYFIDLLNHTSAPTLEVPDASSIAFDTSGDNLLVGYQNGTVLEYPVNSSSAIDSSEASSSVYLRRFTLPVDARVLKVLATDSPEHILAYNDHGQLFSLTTSSADEVTSAAGDSLNIKIIKQHPFMPVLAVIQRNGQLFIKEWNTGVVIELALNDASKEVNSLSFTPEGDVVVGTRSEVVQIYLSVNSEPTASPDSDASEDASSADVDLRALVDVGTYEILRSAKPLVLAELSPFTGHLVALYQ
ncbi:MAG: hypothetical protein HC888_10070 [Candidatus Competibacteraceae bacterium]|nr:hypothetical protein [Candidatus Competibacteraceae bacterium]